MKRFTIFVICVLVGFALILSTRSIGGRMAYVSGKSIKDYKIEISGEKEELKKVKELINSKKSQLDKYKNSKDSHGKKMKIINDLQKELNFYKMLSANQDLQGSGVTITIDDGVGEVKKGEDINNVLVHDEDIIELINSLNNCEAEAISINGQRYINKSAITCNGYTIRINGQFHARPFVIKAIGNPVRFTENLLAPEGYGTKLTGYGVQFKLKVEDNIKIKKYNDDQSDIYATIVKEGVKKK